MKNFVRKFVTVKKERDEKEPRMEGVSERDTVGTKESTRFVCHVR